MKFPKLKNNNFQLGYEHYYDPQRKKGFIEYRILTVRTKLSAEEKRYRVKNKKTVSLPTEISHRLLSDEEHEEKVSWMKNKYPTQEPKESITMYLRETFENRKMWINDQCPSISEIYEKYPRLFDYNGSMIDEEFNLLHPEKEDNFLAKFESFYKPRIMYYVNKNRCDIMRKTESYFSDDFLTLMQLSLIIPPNNYTASQSNSEKSTSESKGSKESAKKEKNLFKEKRFNLILL